MRKIKIIQIDGCSGYYYEYDEDVRDAIIRSITDWEEVSDEDYKKLTNPIALKYLKEKNFTMFSCPENQKEIISKTIQDLGTEITKYEKECALREKRYKEQEKQRKELLAKKAEQKKLKAVEKAKKVLEDYEKNKNTKT